jgi:hypothetical protein
MHRVFPLKRYKFCLKIILMEWIIIRGDDVKWFTLYTSAAFVVA